MATLDTREDCGSARTRESPGQIDSKTAAETRKPRVSSLHDFNYTEAEACCSQTLIPDQLKNSSRIIDMRQAGPSSSSSDPATS
ncbi:hypothetical protein CRENBAI_020826 [Crenichthys baileyi]|uniref:Uncharacterized protein n=1 Tax=Crenichthys baileyi TaxID=28760 RepID=A0AAV9SA62_9TELE